MNYLKLFPIAILILFVSSFGYENTKQYQLDVHHTFVTFKVERFMVGEVSGRFNDLTGTISYDPEKKNSLSADITIKTKSIDTGMELRDGHLKSNIWLDTDKYPEITFKTKKVVEKKGQLMVKADLTIHGVTKEVEFPFILKGPFKDPTGTETLGIQADLSINRQDFGIAFSKKMDNGEMFIGNEVKIEIKALAAMPRSK